MNILIINIKEIVQIEKGKSAGRQKICGLDMSKLSTLKNAYLLIKKGKIADFGSMNELPKLGRITAKEIDATGKMVFPSFCDSHTHLVYAGSREIEYIDKIKGLSYEEIAKRGGGILNSAKRLHNASEEEIFSESLQRLEEIKAYGTGAVEIKSGYGLNVQDELKMLRVIRRLKEISPLTIVSTFLGAHAIPAEYKGNQKEYVDTIINEMIPAVAAEELAEYIDVFCDKGFFTVEDTDRILMAGLKYGLRPKIHANELDYSG
ncbi:MAG: imidazolonepropionase, partial [Bacteroidetes bacterium]|nr:imidazolonepropionase [Bacteroidota bacterium]